MGKAGKTTDAAVGALAFCEWLRWPNAPEPQTGVGPVGRAERTIINDALADTWLARKGNTTRKLPKPAGSGILFTAKHFHFHSETLQHTNTIRKPIASVNGGGVLG